MTSYVTQDFLLDADSANKAMPIIETRVLSTYRAKVCVRALKKQFLASRELLGKYEGRINPIAVKNM
jgi:hypothetical protein